MKIITITLIDGPHGTVSACTDAAPPQVGQGITPAEALALDLLRTCHKQAYQVLHGHDHVPAVKLCHDMLNPESYGHAVTGEVRDAARRAPGRQPIESIRRELGPTARQPV